MPSTKNNFAGPEGQPSVSRPDWLKAKELEVGSIESRIPQGYEDMSPGLIAEAMYKRSIRFVPEVTAQDGADQ